MKPPETPKIQLPQESTSDVFGRITEAIKKPLALVAATAALAASVAFETPALASADPAGQRPVPAEVRPHTSPQAEQSQDDSNWPLAVAAVAAAYALAFGGILAATKSHLSRGTGR